MSDALFSARDVARLSDGDWRVGAFVVMPDDTVGRIVAQTAAYGSTDVWWLVKLGGRTPVVLAAAQARLRLRS